MTTSIPTNTSRKWRRSSPSVGAERLPPLSDWDTLAHLSYRNLNLTEVEISVGDYTGFSDDAFDDEDNEADNDDGKEPDARNEFLVEVGAILRFGNELPESESDEQSLMILDQHVEPLRKLITVAGDHRSVRTGQLQRVVHPAADGCTNRR